MSNFVRRLVSGGKARFKDPQLDLELDLVYVTDHIVIMGYPAAGIESFYRNSRTDAKKFLEHRHGKNFWVYNLCPLRENSYDASIFDGRVSRYPFPDHHAPPLAILALVAREMRQWLSGSPDRIAVIHCKAGKGRSGTLACAYLLSLDDTPSPPKLQRSLTTKEWARMRADKLMETVETEDVTEEVRKEEQNYTDQALEQGETSSTQALRDTETVDVNPVPERSRSASPIGKNDAETSVSCLKNVSDSQPILETHLQTAASPEALSPASTATDVASKPGFSTMTPNVITTTKVQKHTLDDILALHTSRRMRSPSSPDKKTKHGVSIPSQRRWLYYWSLLLANAGPPGFWDLTPSPSSHRAPTRNQTASPRLQVRLTRIIVRMRELSSVKKHLVKFASKAIEKASSAKTMSTSYSATSRSLVDSSRVAESQNREVEKGKGLVWVSLARYDSEFVRTMEKWERWTRDEGGKMGVMREGSGWMPVAKAESGEGTGERVGKEEKEALEELFKDGKWDQKKMVRSFARMGDVEGRKEKEATEDGTILKYTLQPLSSRSWKTVKASIEETNDGTQTPADQTKKATTAPAGTSLQVPLSDADKSASEDESSSANGLGAPLSAVSSATSFTHKEIESAELGNEGKNGGGVVLDAEREVRVKLYIGQVFMGWIWFIPTFHLPHPMVDGTHTEISQKRHSISFARKDIDFPIGAGKGLVDVCVEMEWVQ